MGGYFVTDEPLTPFTFGSVFSGIGGIDLGLERAGFKVKWQSEIDPLSCRVLKKHWADVPNLGDIKQIKWDEVEPVDVIAGGYPCQPFSFNGARKRIGEQDERYLFPEYLRAISVLRPRVAFLENVLGHHAMGFDRVIGDLAEIGYDTEWDIVSASSVGAPHRRERIICLAYPNDTPEQHEHRREVQKSNSWRQGQRNGSDGTFWSVEPDVGRMANGVPIGLDRLRGLGNAVVPQVAEYVGWIIRDLLERQTNG